MTPRAGDLVLDRDHTSHILKMHYFFKNSSYPLPGIDHKTSYIVMMANEWSTKTVNFMTPG